MKKKEVYWMNEGNTPTAFELRHLILLTNLWMILKTFHFSYIQLLKKEIPTTPIQ